MFMIGDAKLRYRKHTKEDVNAGCPKIETRKTRKKELWDQFFPTWVARNQLKKLRQNGIVKECIKVFNSCLLDIKNMSDGDKLHNFIIGLQPWA